MPGQVPRIIYADADLIAVDKPTGWLTHADGPSSADGARPDVVGWLGESVGVHQRLDIDTTGVLVFSRSAQGRQVLVEAFQAHKATKKYLAVVEGRLPGVSGTTSGMINQPVPRAPGKPAMTAYEVKATTARWSLVEANPLTGRTHQVRAHFANLGCPVRGDALYGDPLDLRASHSLLHCAAIDLPTGLHIEAAAPPDFAPYLGQSSNALRAGLEADPHTTCFRVLNGEADGCPGWIVDRYGEWLWITQHGGATAGPKPEARGIYKTTAQRDRSRGAQPPPEHVAGDPAPAPLVVEEHGVRFLVELGSHLSTGLFLDHRPARAWLANHANGMRVLNTFAHAGAFSVAAAVGGAETVSIDLSARWLERIAPQLAANGLSSDAHDSIYGDVFDWIVRLGRRGEKFDMVILDPPSTSVGRRTKGGRSKKRRWSAARDYADLARLAAPLVRSGGQLWTSTNLRQLDPRTFAQRVSTGLPPQTELLRVFPPPIDHPTQGPAPTKCLGDR